MPYKVAKSGSGYRVKNKNTGKTYSKKPQSKAKATAQLKALYANCDEARKYQKSKSLSEKLDMIGKKVIDEWGDNPSQISMRTALNSVVGWDEILRISHGK